METSAAKSPPRLNFIQRALDNPVIVKELKGRMRGRQGFVTLTVYLLLISLFVTGIYLILTAENFSNSNSPDYMQGVGKALFGTVVLLELSMLGFIGPALTSSAISAERERQTFDLLRISLLSAPALALGKLTSAAFYLLLLIFTAIPIQSLAFFLGGVGAAEMIVSTLMLTVTAVFYCALGLFFSSFSKRTVSSTVLTYGSNALSFVFIIFILFMTAVFSPGYYGRSWAWREALEVALWFLFSTNALFAAVMSEALLINDQSVFSATNGISGQLPFPLPSPWIIYVVFYLVLTALLILLSTYFIGRAER